MASTVPARQHRTQCKSHVGAVPHLLDQRRQHARQILPAELRRTGKRAPAVGNEAGVCLLPAIRRQHPSVLPARALHIADLIERRQHAGCELGGFFQHRLRHVQRHLAEIRQLREQFAIHELAQHELHVGQGRVIFVHAWTYMLRR